MEVKRNMCVILIIIVLIFNFLFTLLNGLPISIAISKCLKLGLHMCTCAAFEGNALCIHNVHRLWHIIRMRAHKNVNMYAFTFYKLCSYFDDAF